MLESDKFARERRKSLIMAEILCKKAQLKIQEDCKSLRHPSLDPSLVTSKVKVNISETINE